ncbi:MAG: bifunctional UDP-sugar hydrolase/5'-nucleotidase [Bacteroidales bacterium]|nr:bifunctional UDP-sugar hydrolase/5'-nucleotidase [Bacteroidales bacterium]
MKRIYLLLAAVCLCMTLAAQDVKELLILHTNDTHSRIEPIPESDPNPEYAGKAGFVRRVTLIKEMREKNKDLLLFDCGDFSQGSPYYNMFGGEVEVKLMNEMGYDAGTIGNHEFDFGLDNMARIFRMANFPIVCANYDVKGTVLEGLVKPYVVLERDGVRIGVFGLSPVLEGLVQAHCYGGVVFKDPIEAAQQVADLLKEKEKCDLVICLSHLGWQGEPYSDETLIPHTRNIDIVLGGHSHSYFDKTLFYKNLDGKEIPLQQMGKNAVYVGRMKVTLEKN